MNRSVLTQQLLYLMSKPAWNLIVAKADAEKLLKVFGTFHDGCLREAHVWTEHWVTPDLHMRCTGELDTRVRILIQRQLIAPSAVELLFEQVVAFICSRVQTTTILSFSMQVCCSTVILFIGQMLVDGCPRRVVAMKQLGLQPRKFRGAMRAIGWELNCDMEQVITRLKSNNSPPQLTPAN